MSRSSIIPIFVCMCVLSATAWAETKVYKWADYTKPFGTRLVGIDDMKPTIVEVDLPESVVENKEVILIVSSTFYTGSFSGRVSLSVNERELGSLVSGPNVKVVLERRIVNAGKNILKFSTDGRFSTMAVNDLRIELRDPVDKASRKSSPQDPEGTVYRWTDYTKPFKTRVKVLSDKPGIVQVDLPGAIADQDKVVLDMSTSSTIKTNHRVTLEVNNTELPSFSVGPGARIVLLKGALKVGRNNLRFLCSSIASSGRMTETAAIDIYELRFELPPAQTTTAQTSPPPAPKPIEAKGPVEPEPPTIKQPPASVEPVAPKREETPQTEKAGTAPKKEMAAPVGRTDIGQRWAVVIGVSEYEDSRIPGLRYAARDAQSVYDWLVSPNGGRFAPARVNLLLDRNAANENIKDALFNWLKQAIEEDLVVIFFAGHGSPESPDALHNLYLLPYNTRYSNIAVTGFPMWDIETALKRFIKAKRVVIIADACHSGGVGQAFDLATRTGRGIQVNAINSGLQNLTDLGKGICVISASRDKELSREGGEWGGGHGVFSYYLIEGLKGAADFDNSGTVTIGELTVYVSQQVRRATLNAQNPIVSGSFDPSLTISK
ncbi:MAG TPA: caspase family protein [Desulfobacterales bacterium]|nr:caspase family protein [Desulfobacterales bacterium]